MVLEKIQKPNDIKKLSEDELKILQTEIREFLIHIIAVKKGRVKAVVE